MNGPACKGCGRFDPAGYRPGDCRLCWLWFSDARYAALWGECRFGQRHREPLRVSILCAHVGDDLMASEVERYGLDRRRSWHRCEAGLAKNKLNVPGVACSCDGCGLKCEGYTRAEAGE
ncbi:MAG: hypothetical protein E6R03_01250 [Hyphomicrobiaceae bacterium]|nr:MAG: hypothetical protein E6R03_01250 [Hyphomicrobiaceae bacterium]